MHAQETLLVLPCLQLPCYSHARVLGVLVRSPGSPRPGDTTAMLQPGQAGGGKYLLPALASGLITRHHLRPHGSRRMLQPCICYSHVTALASGIITHHHLRLHGSRRMLQPCYSHATALASGLITHHHLRLRRCRRMLAGRGSPVPGLFLSPPRPGPLRCMSKKCRTARFMPPVSW